MTTDLRKRTAGLLLYRVTEVGLELLLGHPGGPFDRNRDAAGWSIAKGHVQEGERDEDAAVREFGEESFLGLTGPLQFLSAQRQRKGKTLVVWAAEGNADPLAARSKVVRTEFPPGSGRFVYHPEMDRWAWFCAETAMSKLKPTQRIFLDQLNELLANSGLQRKSV